MWKIEFPRNCPKTSLRNLCCKKKAIKPKYHKFSWQNNRRSSQKNSQIISTCELMCNYDFYKLLFSLNELCASLLFLCSWFRCCVNVVSCNFYQISNYLWRYWRVRICLRKLQKNDYAYMVNRELYRDVSKKSVKNAGTSSWDQNMRTFS